MFAEGLSEEASEERISARERREEAPDAVLQLWEIQRWQADPRVAQEEKKLSPSLLPPSLSISRESGWEARVHSSKQLHCSLLFGEKRWKRSVQYN